MLQPQFTRFPGRCPHQIPRQQPNICAWYQAFRLIPSWRKPLTRRKPSPVSPGPRMQAHDIPARAGSWSAIARRLQGLTLEKPVPAGNK